MLLGAGALVRSSFDWLVDYAIDTKLDKVLTTLRIAHLCRLIESNSSVVSKTKTVQFN